MKKIIIRLKKIIILLAALPLIVSCSIYHPQAVDMPLINHKGDMRLDANVSMSGWLVPDALNANVTYSAGITDRLSGQLHANYGGDNAYVQAAPGLYFPMNENFVIETYVGFGYGGIWRNASGTSERKEGESTSTSSYSYSGKYMLPFGQVNVGWHDLGGAHIGLAFGLKVGGYLPNFYYSEFDENGVELLNRAEHYTTTNLLVEPQFQLGLGGEHVRWYTRVGLAWMDAINSKNTSTTFIHDWITIGTGLQFTF